ncbi:NUDIX hydrolase [Paracoccus sp. T5]|uniref:NUDIX hydrolase n=1 Tax=Paracoccus sp. T5 TaxID=3402161 RepID=UPI003AE00854
MEPAPPPLICAVLAVVIRDRQVLLVQRANPPDARLWGFPGGKLEAGETLLDGALRELQEETGVAAVAQRVLTAVDVHERSGDGRLLRHFVLVAVLCRWQGGEPQAADDALDACWIALQDLDRMGTLSRDVARIARLAAQECGD